MKVEEKLSYLCRCVSMAATWGEALYTYLTLRSCNTTGCCTMSPLHVPVVSPLQLGDREWYSGSANGDSAGGGAPIVTPPSSSLHTWVVVVVAVSSATSCGLRIDLGHAFSMGLS